MLKNRNEAEENAHTALDQARKHVAAGQELKHLRSSLETLILPHSENAEATSLDRHADQGTNRCTNRCTNRQTRTDTDTQTPHTTTNTRAAPQHKRHQGRLLDLALSSRHCQLRRERPPLLRSARSMRRSPRPSSASRSSFLFSRRRAAETAPFWPTACCTCFWSPFRIEPTLEMQGTRRDSAVSSRQLALRRRVEQYARVCLGPGHGHQL